MEFGYRLRDAAEAGKLDKVVRELENGTPVDCTSYSSGKSALHIASAAGHHEIVKILLERGANVEVKDAGGETPLHLAVLAGCVQVWTLQYLFSLFFVLLFISSRTCKVCC